MSFKDILERSRLKCAEAAYDKALLASKMRRTAANAGRNSSARVLSGIKARSAARAVLLAPEKIKVRNDKSMPTVRWRGKAGMHVPNTPQNVMLATQMAGLLKQVINELDKITSNGSPEAA